MDRSGRKRGMQVLEEYEFHIHHQYQHSPLGRTTLAQVYLYLALIATVGPGEFVGSAANRSSVQRVIHLRLH